MSETEFIPPETEIELPQPKPQLWFVLIKPYEGQAESAGGIVFADETLDHQKTLSMVGQIVDMGPRAFTDDRFQGSECKIGDWVVYATYTGKKISMRDGREFLIMNDDNILGVIGDPRDYKSYV